MTLVFPDFEARFPDRTLAEHAARTPSSAGDRTLPAGLVHSPRVEAFVNHGRWIAQCPWCAGAEMAHFGDKLFFCTECRNVTVKHCYVPLATPNPHERDQVETLLKVRAVRNRNWDFGEAMADLVRQNQDHAPEPSGVDA